MSDTASGPADPAGHPARRLGGLAYVLLVLLSLGILVDAAAAITDIEQLNVVGRLLAGEDVPDVDLDGTYDRHFIASRLQVLTLLVTASLWLIWFRRAHVNAGRLDPGDIRFGRGWAIGAWFVPVLNLWRPKQIANDIYRSGAIDEAREVPFQERRVPRWLHLWWGLWLVTNLLGRFGFATFYDGLTLEEQRIDGAVTLAADATSALAGAAAIFVVMMITRRQVAAATFRD